MATNGNDGNGSGVGGVIGEGMGVSRIENPALSPLGVVETAAVMEGVTVEAGTDLPEFSVVVASDTQARATVRESRAMVGEAEVEMAAVEAGDAGVEVPAEVVEETQGRATVGGEPAGSSAGPHVEIGLMMERIFDDLDRDQSRGKGPVVSESPDRRILAETQPDVEVPLFTPRAGTSSHQPIRRADFLEFLGEEHLEELGRDHPAVLATVLRMRDRHVVDQARREKEVASIMEAEAEARRQENAARAREEARERRVTAVEEAGRQSSPGFSEGVPNLPEVHLIVLGGGDSWEMRWEIYSDDQDFRDREFHLRTSWREV